MRVAIVLLAMTLTGSALYDRHPSVSPIYDGNPSGESGAPPVGGSGAAFDFNPMASPGLENFLSGSVTINDTTVSPVFSVNSAECDINDCDDWTGEQGFSIPAISASFGRKTGPYESAYDDALDFGAGGNPFYADTTLTRYDVGTKDLYFEAWYQADTDGGGATLFSTRTDTNNSGFQLFDLGTGIRLLWGNGTSIAIQDFGTNVIAGDWVFIGGCIDRDENSTNGARIYRGVGSLLGSANLSAYSADSWDAPDGIGIGMQPGISNPAGSGFMYTALWAEEDWFAGGATTASDCQAHQAARAAALFGLNATGASTISYSRDSRAFQTRNSSDGTTARAVELISVDRHTPRIEQDEHLNEYYLHETTSENELVRSSDWSTGWTTIGAGDTSGGSLDDPRAETCTDCGVIAAAVTDQEHGYTQTATLGTGVHTVSAYFKSGAKVHFLIEVPGIANAFTYFQGSSCTRTANGAAVIDYFAEDIEAGDWCRVGFSFNVAAGGSYAIDYQIAEAANDKSFAGDGSTVQGYIAFPQAEASPYPSSFIETFASTVTREADSLTFTTAAYDNDGGSMTCEVGQRDYTNGALAYAATLSNGTAANLIGIGAGASDQGRMLVTTASVNVAEIQPGTTTIFSGGRHIFAASFEDDDYTLSVNTSTEGTDNAGTMPTGLTTVTIGSSISDASPYPGAYKRCRVWNATGRTDVPETQLAFIGDSITLNYPRHTTFVSDSNYSVYNYGAGGETCLGMITSQQPLVEGRGFDQATLLCGVNDLIGGRTPAQANTDAESILDDLELDGVETCMLSILPVDSGVVAYATWDTLRDLHVASSSPTTLIETTSTFSLDDGVTLRAGYYRDTVHPSYTTGDQALADLAESCFP